MAGFSRSFHNTTKLLLQILPFVSEEMSFSLKGGTAINFFIHDMPRLSVDIDLTYAVISPRDIAIEDINRALNNIAKNIQRKMPNLLVQTTNDDADNTIKKILVHSNDTNVKIETNSIFRGNLFPPEKRELCKTAQNEFELFITMHVVSLADLYAGKICATLSRQHPRDLFDTKVLLGTMGISNDLRQSFIIYLCSDRRPMHELLSPNVKNQKSLFNNEFVGMLRNKITYQELENIVPILSKTLKEQFTPDEKQFLLSLAAGEPEWNYMNIPNISQLPALQWKLLNIRKMDSHKRKTAFLALQKSLDEITS